MEETLVQIATVLFVGVMAQWIAWSLRIPSIVLLLCGGFVVGPLTDFLPPQYGSGEVLFAFVSVAVAIILFEGGLSLRFSEISSTRRIVFSLVSVGFLVTWIILAWAAKAILGLDLLLAVLLGAILTVSGPTVVIPLLRQVSPQQSLSQILKWEGILIDPIGAIAAVLVYEVLIEDLFQTAYTHVVFGVLETLLFGGGFGIIGALLIAVAMRRHLVPEYLEIPFTLMVVIIAHVGANYFRPDSGLLAVTLMGVVLANMTNVSLRSVLEFKENLVLLLISVLFVVLAARIRFEDLAGVNFWRCAAFLFVVIFIARPACVAMATIGSQLTIKQRLFLGFLSPRGIVAAAVSSLFALELTHHGFKDAHLLMPYTFLVIVATVIVYGLGARPVGRLLGVLESAKEGVLFLGAQPLVRAIAKELGSHGVQILLVDSNAENIRDARLEGLRAYHGNVLSNDVLNGLDLSGIGRFLAMTANGDTNSLAAVQFSEIFGRQEVYQLAQNSSQRRHEAPEHLRGRFLFQDDADYFNLEGQYLLGGVVKSTQITEKFTIDDYKELYNDRFVPLFVITETGQLTVVTADRELKPKAGSKLVSLVEELTHKIPRPQ